MIYRVCFVLAGFTVLTFSSCGQNKSVFNYNQDVAKELAVVNQSGVTLGKKLGPYTQGRPLDPKEFEEFLGKRTVEISGALDRAEKLPAPDSPAAKDFKAKLDAFIAGQRSMVQKDLPRILKIIQDNPQPTPNSVAAIGKIFDDLKTTEDQTFRPLISAQEKMAKAHKFKIEPAK